MKITKEKSNDIKDLIVDWATKKKITVEFTVRGTAPTFGIEHSDWGIEILAQDGWAYINGFKSLSDVSTSVTDMDDISEALDRLLTHLPK